MSFKSKFSSKDLGTPDEIADAKAKEKEEKRKKAAKQNPLLNAKTDRYVDDSNAYKVRISAEDKLVYWAHLLGNSGRRPLPKGIESGWKKAEEAHAFSKYHLFVFDFFTSLNWDQSYLNLLLLWLLVLIFFGDGWAEAVGLESLQAPLLVVPPLLMFLCQIVPLLSMLYFEHFWNDLVHSRGLLSMTSWAFVSALTAQYVEFFHYQGRGRGDRAGRLGHSGKNKVVGFLKNMVKTQHAQVSPGDEGEEGSGDEGVALGELEEGKGESGGQGGQGGQGRENIVSEDERRAPPPSDDQLMEMDDDETIEDPDVEKVVGIDDKGNETITYVPIDFTLWTCIVCNTDNRRRTHERPDADIKFGENGVYYKRTYAKILHRRPVPSCIKCYTYCDYQPPQGSAHLFPHNPHPHVAFTDYPRPSAVQAGLKPDYWSRNWYAVRSFFYGIKDDYGSAPLKNDWRLKKFVDNRFPEMPRYLLKDGERFLDGEMVECKQQKAEWNRARVVVAHKNSTYDIRYDTGDQIRFVLASALRTCPEKRAYAYRIEMGMVFMVVCTPLLAVLGALSGNFGLMLMGVLIPCVLLLLLRLKALVQYFCNYYNAGLNTILCLGGVFTLPLVFLVAACALGVTGGADPNSWGATMSLFIVAKLLSLPVLYMLRPSYLVVGLIVFPQTSAGMVLLSMYAAKTLTLPFPVAIALAPFITVTIFAKVLRKNLHAIWDVCIVIRQARDTSSENPDIFVLAKNAVFEYFDL